jgi:hypothetical protein
MGVNREKVEGLAIDGGFRSQFVDLRAAGLTPQRAFFVAWFNAPKDARKPKTQREVAELLEIREPTLSEWKHQKWFIELNVGEWRTRTFLHFLADVDRKTFEAALHGGAADRRLFYEQLRDAQPDATEGEEVLIWLRKLRQTGKDEMADSDTED